MFQSVPAKLNPYYTQAYQWNGQFTVASSSVSKLAILTATETAANMLRHRPDIAARMTDSDSRLAIIPGNGTTLEIPEHSPFAAVKGYGGTLAIPVTSVTENNVLKLAYPDNSHYAQNITVHEFAHSIENIGFDAGLRNQLSEAFAKAKASGLWVDTYAITNEDEYFAELSEAYFDHSRAPDSSKNNINTRELLATYDANGFALMVTVYGNDAWRDGDWSGSNSADVLNGLATSDFIFGNGGDDTIFSGGGSDSIDGGDGFDTAVVAMVRQQTTVSRNADGSFTAKNGADTIELVDVEMLMLSDATVRFDADGNAGQAYRVYKAAFNRTPDNDGLKHWVDSMDQGTELQNVATGFVNSAEFMSVYGADPTNQMIVEKFYQNVLGRDGESAGTAYWVGELNTGNKDVASVLAGFSQSPENIAGVSPEISDGIWLV